MRHPAGRRRANSCSDEFLVQSAQALSVDAIVLVRQQTGAVVGAQIRAVHAGEQLVVLIAVQLEIADVLSCAT